MSFDQKVIDLKYKNCEYAFGFKDWKSFLEFYETSTYGKYIDSEEDNKHLFLANFKPKNNHKGELVFQRGGARIALCCMETAEAIPTTENKLIICKVNVKELKDGCRIFYADQRVIGEDISKYIEFIKRTQIRWGQNPDINLPKVRYPLSDAERKQRVDAGRKRTDELSDKDELIKQLEARIEQLERENVKLEEKANEALDKLTEYIQKQRQLSKEKQKKAPVPIYFDIEEEDEKKEQEFEI